MLRDDGPDWLSAFPALSDVGAQGRRRLRTAAKAVRLPAGAALFRAGEGCGGYPMLTSGTVRVQMISDTGREIVLYRITPGQTCVLTTACLLSEDLYPAEAVAETAIEAFAVSPAEFDALMAEDPAFRRFVFASYGQRIGELLLLVEEVAFRRVDVRLARLILQRRDDTGRLRATHEQLAVELGTAREVISRQLKEFERRGWIRLARGGLTTLNDNGLRRLVEPDPA